MTPPTRSNAPDHVLRRSVGGPGRYAVGGSGAEILDSEGRRWLDGSSGVFVAILGANPPGVAERIAESMSRLQFAYSGQFASAEEDALAAALAAHAPEGIGRVWLATSGSAANESAVKLARQYHLLRGAPEKTAVITRWHSYHGGTIGAMSLSGSGPRRRPYQPYLLDFPHVPAPDAYHRPPGYRPDDWALACADAVEAEILARGAQYVSAVMVEPVAGAPLGALVSPDAYLARIREICGRHDVLMIADEVVSGLGRTGRWFAMEHTGVVPDMITLAKGLGGGFTPIGALLVHDRVSATLDEAGTAFAHGESFTGHRMMGAAGAAVLAFIEEHDLVARIARDGPALEALLRSLADHPLVGALRGRGFLHGIELVADKETRRPFPRADRISERVAEATARRGVLFQTGNAGADGKNGDTVMIAPPYVTTDAQLAEMVGALAEALDEVAAELGGCGVARGGRR